MDSKIDIGKIIESINKKSVEPTQDSTDATGLVFEVQTEASEEPAVEPTPATAPEEKSEVREEFTIPDVFSVTEQYDEPSTDDYTSHIHKTYVPRFTSASENYKIREGEPTNTPRPEAKRQEPQRTDIDPTAELNEESVDGAVVVDMTKPRPEDSGDILNVYKFADGEAKVPEVRERTVDDEREEIESLLQDTPTTEEAEEPMAEQTAEAPKRAEDYELPDPDIEIKKEKNQDENKPAGEPTATAPTRRRAAEYTVKKDRDDIVQRFLDIRFATKIRLCAAVLFSLLTLGFEVLASFGIFSDNIFSIPVTSMAVGIVDLLLALCALALALPEIIFAVRWLFVGKLLSTLLPVVTYTALIVYYSVIFALGGISEYPLFGFIATVSAISAIIGAIYKANADFEAFKLISKSDDMQAVKSALTRENPRENIALDGLIDEYKSYASRAVSTSFVNGFIKNSGKIVNNTKHILFIIFAALGIAVVSSSVAYFTLGGIVPAVTTLAATIMLGVPAFSIISHGISYFDSNRTLALCDTCACGENAYYEVAKTDVIVFNDVDIFGPDDVNLKRYVFLGEGDNIDGTMRQTCSLFSVIGGPLGALFSNALDSRITTKRAHNVETASDGLSGEVGGHRVSAGSFAYMQRQGVKLPDASGESKLDTTKVIYATEDGKLTAKFYIRYSFSEEFTMAQPLLRREGVVPLIYTSDPNINDELLKLLTAGTDSMRVIKTGAVEELEISRGEAATIVTTGDRMDLASVVLHAKKHKRFADRLASSETYAMAVGSVLAVLLSFFGMLTVPAYVFSVWQIAWCFVMRFASRSALAPQRQDKEKDAE